MLGICLINVAYISFSHVNKNINIGKTMLTFINNLSIRYKLYGLAFFPLLGFISFAGYNFLLNYQEKIVLEEMLVLNNSASVSALLVHELQKERGASAGYLSSKGKKFQQAIKQHRRTTDQQQQSLQAFIRDQKLTPQLSVLFSEINQKLNKIPELRERIDNLAVSVKEEVDFYTQLNALLLSIIDNTANQNKNVELAISAVAVGSFLQHKERAGIERAVMSSVFSQNNFTPSTLQKFISLLAEQQTYLKKFKAHATNEQYSIYENTVQGDVIQRVNEFRQIALNKMREGKFDIDPTVWFDIISQKINLLKSVEVTLLNQLNNTNIALISEKNNLLTNLIIISLLPLILVLGLSFYVAKQLHSGINEITQKIVKMTSNDDLTLRIEIESEDELGDISYAINHLVSHLQGLVENIQNTSNMLKVGLLENMENNQQISEKIDSGSDQVTQVVTATTEMNSTVAEIARNAIQASTETEKANNVSRHGNHEVEKTIENINQLSVELNNASSVTEKLNSATINISQFINVIKSISEKTNLLALNAAIEAARAGESGRGFAVVADEVRSLALQTKESTNEIEMMITELQSSSNDTQATMSRGIKMVDESVVDIQKTGKDISHITIYIDEINQMNEQIATAAEEQSSVTEEINRNMVNIQDGYTDMQVNYENIEKCNRQIEILAEELNGAVNKFKI
jgi:methyl-accepting chemotaxis protein